MANRTLGIALIGRSCLYTADAPSHRMTPHGSPRLLEAWAKSSIFVGVAASRRASIQMREDDWSGG
jgi:hypothetical protein